MRFAGMEKMALASRARVRDLSSSGISFLIEPGNAPAEGDMLKIEFQLPNRRQLAWFATVVRIESRIEWQPEFGQRAQTVVAAKFRPLPAPLSRAIQKGLYGRAASFTSDEAAAEDVIEVQDPEFRDLTARQFLTLGALIVSTVFVFGLMALPPQFLLKPFHGLFT
jgi:hypothetical protein